MSEYPEHDKMMRVVDRTQAVGDFLSWVGETHGLVLMQWVPEGGGCADEVGNYMPSVQSILDLMAEWTDIDLTKIENEKREMLERIRALNSPINQHLTGRHGCGTQDLDDEGDRPCAGSGASEEDATPPPG